MKRVATSRGEEQAETSSNADAAFAGDAAVGEGRMAYWRPAADLAPFVSGYHFYEVDPPRARYHLDVFQPAWFSLRVLLTSRTDWHVRVGKGRKVRVPDLSLFGPSSAVTWSQSTAGQVVGAGLTPLGWLRLTRVLAVDWADRVGDPGPIFGPGLDEFASEIRRVSPDEAPALFHAFLAPLLSRPQRSEDRVAAMTNALLDPSVQSVHELAKRVMATERTIERLASRAFGFAPKFLLRRSRFLRSLHAIFATGRGDGALAIDPGYTDYSHFVREAHAFLGMAPRRFLAIGAPMLTRSLILRKAQLGAPAQALLDGPARTASGIIHQTTS